MKEFKNITKKKIIFNELLDPKNCYGNLSLYFDLIRYITRIFGDNEKVMQCLEKKPYCIGCGRVVKVFSNNLQQGNLLEDLRLRVSYLLFSQIKEVEDSDIGLCKSKIITGLRCNDDYGCGLSNDLVKKIFLEIPEQRKFRKSLNSFHKKAVFIKDVGINIYSDSYVFEFVYGYTHSGNWSYLIESKENEYFYEFVNRVYRKIFRETIVI